MKRYAHLFINVSFERHTTNVDLSRIVAIRMEPASIMMKIAFDGKNAMDIPSTPAAFAELCDAWELAGRDAVYLAQTSEDAAHVIPANQRVHGSTR